MVVAEATQHQSNHHYTNHPLMVLGYCQLINATVSRASTISRLIHLKV